MSEWALDFEFYDIFNARFLPISDLAMKPL